jgi:hypothetical protein
VTPTTRQRQNFWPSPVGSGDPVARLGSPGWRPIANQYPGFSPWGFCGLSWGCLSCLRDCVGGLSAGLLWGGLGGDLEDGPCSWIVLQLLTLACCDNYWRVIDPGNGSEHCSLLHTINLQNAESLRAPWTVDLQKRANQDLG